MLNGIFVALVLLSVVIAAWSGRMEVLTRAIVDSAMSAVEIALKLVGVMALFLGLMRVASDSGLMRVVSRAVAPLMRLLFPAIPKDHPAIGAMIMNITANFLGLANAATPFGIKAMMELDRLNGEKGTATDAMVLFLAINTSGFALLPSSVISLRAAAGSQDPAGIFATAWFASGCATVAAILAAWLFSRLPRVRATAPPVAVDDASRPASRAEAENGAGAGIAEEPLRPPRLGGWIAGLFVVLVVVALVVHVARSTGSVPARDLAREILSFWILPTLVAGLVLFGWARGVKVYASLVEGAKEGFQVAIRIIPYLVAILVMVGMFRESGGLGAVVWLLDPITSRIGLPAEALPMALLRPLSGSGAYAVAADIMSEHGADSLIGYMVSTFQGSTETTFYVLAVYFGAIGVKRTRHALPACLTADVAGILAAVFIVNLIFG